MFQTVLIANRGEIACRIIRTLGRMGIRSVAVYSDADAGARHVRLADAAVRLGPAPAASSYLDIDAVIRAAQRTGADAIHPGYGFLAENAAFADACAAAGIVFIGPDAATIRTMGDKIAAKLAVERRGVPTVPGAARPGMTDADLVEAAAGVGYPLLIKPSAGGGGKGMHVVERQADLAAAIAAARREAAAGFGDDTLFLERYVTSPRHIEVQVLADAAGTTVHLGERECSLQRRHQKVIEEAPSPLLDEATRARIGAAACETARSVGYRGAGTVEFIVAAGRPDEFFFMEMNTRLQVEHPVTEEITGIDLVEQQLRIAAGEPLAIGQGDVVLAGHAIEVRVYAEDPAAGFLPTGGVVEHVQYPGGAGIRVDTGIEDGMRVGVDYDPMLAKIIASGADREDARRRLVAALERTAVFGFPTNIAFLHALLRLPAVVAGDLDTGLIARELDGIPVAEPDEQSTREAALLLDAAAAHLAGPWGRGDGWRLGEPAARTYRFDDGRSVRLVGTGDGLRILTGDDAVPATASWDAGTARVTIGGVARAFPASVTADRVELVRDGAVLSHRLARAAARAEADADRDPVLTSPMPGTVVLTHVDDGAQVAAGDPVVVVEAMKMEHVVRSAVAGIVTLFTAPGATVARGEKLAVIVAETGTEHAP